MEAVCVRTHCATGTACLPHLLAAVVNHMVRHRAFDKLRQAAMAVRCHYHSLSTQLLSLHANTTTAVTTTAVTNTTVPAAAGTARK